MFRVLPASVVFASSEKLLRRQLNTKILPLKNRKSIILSLVTKKRKQAKTKLWCQGHDKGERSFWIARRVKTWKWTTAFNKNETSLKRQVLWMRTCNMLDLALTSYLSVSIFEKGWCVCLCAVRGDNFLIYYVASRVQNLENFPPHTSHPSIFLFTAGLCRNASQWLPLAPCKA